MIQEEQIMNNQSGSFETLLGEAYELVLEITCRGNDAGDATMAPMMSLNWRKSARSCAESKTRNNRKPGVEYQNRYPLGDNEGPLGGGWKKANSLLLSAPVFFR